MEYVTDTYAWWLSAVFAKIFLLLFSFFFFWAWKEEEAWAYVLPYETGFKPQFQIKKKKKFVLQKVNLVFSLSSHKPGFGPA